MKREREELRAAEWAGARSGPGADVFSLLRYAHIFSTVVREVLEVKLLEQTSPLPLTLSQFHLLKLMSFNGRHQIGDLAEFLGVTPPAATRNVDKLEGLGLIVRNPSAGDRRATLISVSPKGSRLVKRYEELKRARLLPVLDEFTPAELDQLAALLERFAVSVLEKDKSTDGACLRCAAYVQPDCPVGKVRGGCPYKKVRAGRPHADEAGA